MFISKFISFCDVPKNWQLGLQNHATPTVEIMAFFHDYLNSYMIIIGTCVFFLLYTLCLFFDKKMNPKANEFTHNSLLEIIWIILPAFVLLLLAIPSFTLLYSLDESSIPSLTLKVIGYQRYWSYEIYNTILLKDIFDFRTCFKEYFNLNKIRPLTKRYLLLQNLNVHTILFLFCFYYIVCFFMLLYYEFKFLYFSVNFPEIFYDIMAKKIFLNDKDMYLHKALEISINCLKKYNTTITQTDNELSHSLKKCYNFVFFIPIFFNIVPKAKISFMDQTNLKLFTKFVNAFKYDIFVKNRYYDRLRSNILNLGGYLDYHFPVPNDVNKELLFLHLNNIKTIYYLLKQNQEEYFLLRHVFLNTNLQLIIIHECICYNNVILNLY